MTTVWVTHSFVAFHNWPLAPEGRGYLRASHRHMFCVRAEAAVEHADRAIEFHDLLDVVAVACSALGRPGRWIGLRSGVQGKTRELGQMSCEQIAQAVFDAVEKEWPGQAHEVIVSEDGEAGGTVRRVATYDVSAH